MKRLISFVYLGSTKFSPPFHSWHTLQTHIPAYVTGFLKPSNENRSSEQGKATVYKTRKQMFEKRFEETLRDVYAAIFLMRVNETM